ncbi:polymer-forming cytoskeletal protein [Chitiniphilus eburneus]|uniref:Polymer-forming cytoskeletal protein n=1 Tax=Chitiniphilus eburneus TaxID=2571148 RepID=A0A4U0QDV0_9NEIS|nr:polymer-forming cytoskeletal protein [Chitiniphilus eburneus]TJZ78802.1 polymer-forming cytoskeletal protein [Chitiniphilus eburneus]
MTPVLKAVSGLILMFPLPAAAQAQLRRFHNTLGVPHGPAVPFDTHSTLSAPQSADHDPVSIHTCGRLDVKLPLRFKRLAADELCFGNCAPFQPAPAWPRHPGTQSVKTGDVTLDDGSHTQGDLFVHGNLYIGHHARINGGLTVDGNIMVSAGTHINGGIIARGILVIGPGVRISGPVLSHRQVVLSPRSVIGLWHQPASVSAPRVLLDSGCRVFGSVAASEHGWAASNAGSLQ